MARMSFPARWRDDVIKWKHFPRYWPFVRGMHRLPMNSPHKGQWRGALMFSLICTRRNGWVNNRNAGDLRCHRAHYNVTVMELSDLAPVPGHSLWPWQILCHMYWLRMYWQHRVLLLRLCWRQTSTSRVFCLMLNRRLSQQLHQQL